MVNKLIFVFLVLVVSGIAVFRVFALEARKADENTYTGAALSKEGNPFGVLEFLHWNHDWNKFKYPDRGSLEKAVSLMKDAGVGWVRVDFLWSDIEPSAGAFAFEKYDTFVQLLSENQIRILGVLHYSTDWASSCGKWNCPPSDNAVFVRYAVKVINRYKDKVKHWELWNEPDSHVYWEQQDGLKRYCRLLQEVYTAAKKEDPDCKILNGGLANGLAGVHHLYDNGAKDYFDILNLHVFDTPVNAKAIKRVIAYPNLAYKIMARNGDKDKKIWITEIGCPGVQPELKTANWWMGSNPGEKQQAKWVEEVYVQLLNVPPVEKVFWAFFRDTKQHWNTGVDYFGLVRWDFSKKPAFDSYKKCSAEWRKNARGRNGVK
ncbi:MAG: beta-galactosidase [Candidatus Omnitrophota bacterium]|jgi:hypothetical protein